MVIKGNNGNVFGNIKQELGILTNTKWLMVGRPPEKIVTAINGVIIPSRMETNNWIHKPNKQTNKVHRSTLDAIMIPNMFEHNRIDISTCHQCVSLPSASSNQCLLNFGCPLILPPPQCQCCAPRFQVDLHLKTMWHMHVNSSVAIYLRNSMIAIHFSHFSALHLRSLRSPRSPSPLPGMTMFQDQLHHVMSKVVTTKFQGFWGIFQNLRDQPDT